MKTSTLLVISTALSAGLVISAACNTQATGVCDTYCECTICNDLEEDFCADGVAAVIAMAEAYECNEEIEAMTECINDKSDCDDNNLDLDSCKDEGEDLGECFQDKTDLKGMPSYLNDMPFAMALILGELGLFGSSPTPGTNSGTGTGTGVYTGTGGYCMCTCDCSGGTTYTACTSPGCCSSACSSACSVVGYGDLNSSDESC